MVRSIKVSRNSREGNSLHSLRTVIKACQYLLWAFL